MIRLVYVLRRNPKLSHETFCSKALEFGATVESRAESLGISKHVQLHNIVDPVDVTVDPLRGEMLRPFDAVLEFWFDDLETLLRHEQAMDELVDLESEFIDHSSSSAWISYEVPHINPTPENVVATPDSSLVRLFYSLRAPETMTIDEAQWYWRVQHGPLVRRCGPDIQTLRYIQVHALEHEFNQRFASKRGLGEAFYGHAELWFDRTAEPTAGAVEAGILLYEDEYQFIDFSRSAIFYGKEHLLVGI